MRSVLIFIIICVLSACTLHREENTNESLRDLSDGLLEAFPNANEIDPTWSQENTIVYHVLGEPDDMHPTNGGSHLKSFIFSLTQAYLLEPDGNSPEGVKPSLVETLPIVSKDGLAYTYHLRSEPKWDDQTSISVKDVIFSFKAAKCPLTNNPHLKPYIENLEFIRQDSIDPLKFIIKVKEKNVLNLAFVTGFPLLQESYWDSLGALREFTFGQFDDSNFDPDLYPNLREWASHFNAPKFSRTPEFLVGLGPFEFKSWKPGQSFELVRKTQHWTQSTDPLQGVDRIIFKINADPNSQFLEFKTEVIDGSHSLSLKNFQSLRQNTDFTANYNSTLLPSYVYTYLGLNTRPDGIKHKKLFDDVGVRKAVALAIPYDEINKIVYGGDQRRISSPVSPLKDECNKDIPLVQLDLNEARRMLDEAGWVDTDNDNVRDKMIDGIRVPFVFDLNYLHSPTTWKTQAMMISESLNEVGIKCNPVQMSFAVLRQKNKLHDFDAMLSAWAGSSFPQDYSQVWGTSSWSNQGSNYVGFGNVETDLLIDSINAAINPEKRKLLSFQLQELIADQQPYVFLFAGNKRIVVHKRFSNVNLSADPPYLFLDQWHLSNRINSTDVN